MPASSLLSCLQPRRATCACANGGPHRRSHGKRPGAPPCPTEACARPGPGRRGLGLVCALAFAILWPGAAATEELAWGDVATPLRIVNLNPFQLLYGVPGPLGAHVMARGSSELIASMDMASHLIEASSGAERVLIDGETYGQGLAMRHGFGDGWEYLFEAAALSHRTGAFDGFIETWHDVFHLPQGGRDRAPRDRLALFYANGGRTYYDIGRNVSSLGDISLGVGYAVPHWPFPNDGLAIRGIVKLPTGDEASLAGSGGYSASLWAETSGALPGSAGTRSWLYSASLGALAGEAAARTSGPWQPVCCLRTPWRDLAATQPSEPDGADQCPFLALWRIGCGAARRSWRYDRPRRRVAAQRARDA